MHECQIFQYRPFPCSACMEVRKCTLYPHVYCEVLEIHKSLGVHLSKRLQLITSYTCSCDLLREHICQNFKFIAVWNLKNWNIATLTWRLSLDSDLRLIFLRLLLHFGKIFWTVWCEYFTRIILYVRPKFHAKSSDWFGQNFLTRKMYTLFTPGEVSLNASVIYLIFYRIFLEWNLSSFTGNTKKIPLASKESRFEI